MKARESGLGPLGQNGGMRKPTSGSATVVLLSALVTLAPRSDRLEDKLGTVPGILKALGAQPGSTLADVGAGDGFFPEHLVTEAGFEIHETIPSFDPSSDPDEGGYWLLAAVKPASHNFDLLSRSDLTDADVRAFVQGAGGTPLVEGGVAHFLVEAPVGVRPRVVGDFNDWGEGAVASPMEPLGSKGSTP